MVLSVWHDRYERSLFNMKYVCIFRVPSTNPALTSKCSNLLPSEEHIQKLKEAGKDGEKQLIIVSNALLVRFIVSETNYFWISSAVFLRASVKILTCRYYYRPWKWFLKIEPLLNHRLVFLEEVVAEWLTFKTDSC